MYMKNKVVKEVQAEHRGMHCESTVGLSLSNRPRGAALPGVVAASLSHYWVVKSRRYGKMSGAPETPLALRKLWHGCTLSFQGEFF